jgi:uncharacterized membrane protein YdjX (TVP38/TMEM64 family)
VERGFLAVLAADHTVAQLAVERSPAAAAVASAIREEPVAAVLVVVVAVLVRTAVPVPVPVVSARNTPFQA